ncbi:hypothetical protein P691DRAFT_778309 [Macrolepiota fuliginosa MF-IS2]|uniref:Protein kinase domain-containing protein n=1 Tax=Macrolepiota fuliginosa MF-IS2 TaxID=1400762 RepID=A0A9P5X739_9AGAR|nr:hypothetical protein P691DRAFT_778309 [Macrolepiota fuliginosa MF-IS2]
MERGGSLTQLLGHSKTSDFMTYHDIWSEIVQYFRPSPHDTVEKDHQRRSTLLAIALLSTHTSEIAIRQLWKRMWGLTPVVRVVNAMASQEEGNFLERPEAGIWVWSKSLSQLYLLMNSRFKTSPYCKTEGSTISFIHLAFYCPVYERHGREALPLLAAANFTTSYWSSLLLLLPSVKHVAYNRTEDFRHTMVSIIQGPLRGHAARLKSVRYFKRGISSTLLQSLLDPVDHDFSLTLDKNDMEGSEHIEDLLRVLCLSSSLTNLSIIDLSPGDPVKWGFTVNNRFRLPVLHSFHLSGGTSPVHELVLRMDRPGNSFELLGFVSLALLPQDTLEPWVDEAEKYIRIKKSLSPDTLIYIDLYQLPQGYPVSYFQGRTTVSLEEVFKNTLNFDFIKRHAASVSPSCLAGGVGYALVAVYGYNAPDRILSPVSELPERRGMHREAVANAAQKRRKPSDGEKLSESRSEQSPHHLDAVYNGRPCTLLAPFVGIYHPDFASFTHIMASPPDQLEPKLTHEELDWGTSLVSQSLLFYPTKADRMLGIQNILGHAVSPTMLSQTTLTLSTDRGSRTIIPDGVLQVMSSAKLPMPCALITEVKNEIGEGGSDPAAQATCDYVAIYTSNGFKSLRDVSCCPTLLVGIAGPRMIISGAVFTDRPIVQELTDYITLGPCATTANYNSGLDRATYRAAQLLRALKEGFSVLSNYYQSGIHLSPQFPQFPHFRQFNTEGSAITVEYFERFDLLPHKSVFKARVTKVTSNVESTVAKPTSYHLQEGEIVVIKFAYRYCKEAHSLLARQEPRLAPKFWYCQYEPTVDMRVIMMEFVDGHCLDGGPALSQQQFGELRRALQILHENRFIFGDLREPNILVPKEDKSCVRLVDFDWSGKEGEVRYPSCIIMDEPGYQWHPEVERGGLIKEHDIHLLHKIMPPKVDVNIVS